MTAVQPHHREIARVGLVHIAGWKPDDKADLHRDYRLASLPGIPLLRAHRLHWPRIRNQGPKGACTANAGAGMYEAREPDGGSVEYSADFGYSMTRLEEGTPLTEDSGCQVRDVLSGMAKRGLCLESTFPYDPDIIDREPTEAALAEGLLHKASLYYRLPTILSMKASIAQGFPFIFGFQVYTSMMSDAVAASGHVTFPEDNEDLEGGHCVAGAAYDDDMEIGEETGAFGCPNSWGEGWGDRGWLWLPYRYFRDGLADDAWTLRRAAV